MNGHENDITNIIIGSAIEVHSMLGPGLLESTYEECLCHELMLRKCCFERQKELSVSYKTINLDCGYRIDLVVSKLVVVELKAVGQLEPIHEAQLLTYLKLTGLKVGVLINFNVLTLKNGIKRMVNNFKEVNFNNFSARSASLR
ncbi:GxxExxY protein [bacterium]|nr:GxxExxY protein [bacterium]